MQTTVVENKETPPGLIAEEITAGIMDDLLPPGAGSPAAAPIEIPDPITSGREPALGQPAATPPLKTPPAPASAKAGEPVSPTELRGTAKPAAPKPADGDDQPAHLIKDNEIDAAFKNDPKAKQAILNERGYNKELRGEVKTLKGENDTLKTKVAEYEAKLADLQGKTSVDPNMQKEFESVKAEREQLRTELAKLQDEIGKIDLTRNPSFKAQFDDRINAVGGKMVRTLASEGVEAAEAESFVKRLVAERRPSARERMIRDYAPGLEGTLTALTLEIDAAVQERAAALEKWKDTAAGLQETEARSRLAALTSKVDDTVKTAVDEVVKLGNPYFMRVADDPEWNAEVAKREAALRGILLTGDYAKIAPLVAEGMVSADFRARYVQLRDKYNEVVAQLEEVTRGGGTGFYGGAPRGGEGGAPAPSVPEGMPLSEAIEQDLRPPVRR